MTQPQTTRETIEFHPLPGPQDLFLRCTADVAIFGGAAGGGKTVALLMAAGRRAAVEPVRDFGAVIFRRTNPQITQQGGLWDESAKLYAPLGGTPRQAPTLQWSWPAHGTRVSFHHMQYDVDRFNYQGSQIPWIGFDELTHFTEDMFFYMLSRNRSTCGVKPVMRATTNPDADSWVRSFLAPWVDPETPHPAHSGEIRWFYREGGVVQWVPPGVGKLTRNAMGAPCWRRSPDAPEQLVKSATFIASRITDNPILLKSNPEYLANLMALPLVERQRLLYGDWTIRPSGNMFKRHWFPIVDAAPVDFVAVVRRWDLAGTEPRKGYSDPDYTCGVKMGMTAEGKFYILDVLFLRETPGAVKATVKQMAELDGRGVAIRFAQDPGQAGVDQYHDYVTELRGYVVTGRPETGDKEVRARAFSSQCEVGNVALVRGAWNEMYLNQVTPFPMTGVHDDAVDASSGAFDYLVNHDATRSMRWLSGMAGLVQSQVAAQETHRPPTMK